MVDPSQSPKSAVYEIRLAGEIPMTMREQFPTMMVYRTPIQTVLYRELTDLTELDALLEELQCMNLVPSELRASLHPDLSDPPASFREADRD
jgi:hypothetical protein